MSGPQRNEDKHALNHERRQILAQLESWLEWPMIVLAFAWLALLVVEVVQGETHLIKTVGTAIWIIFIADFVVKFAVSPDKRVYLRHNWLTALSLVVPALRGLRVFAALRFARLAHLSGSLRLVRVISSVNRGMQALSTTMKRRGFGFVVLLTIVVILAGAAGMYGFEREVVDPNGLHNYGTALWWTAMLITTIGTDYFPKTVEGRVLCFTLALYAFAVFGYITATIASFFIDRDANDPQANVASDKSIAALRDEIIALRKELRARDAGRE